MSDHADRATIVPDPATREVPVCPGCGGPTRSVGTKTVKHLVLPGLAHGVRGRDFSFCPAEECDVYYVRLRAGDAEDDPQSMSLEIYSAKHIKDRALPFARGADRLVCHCFGYTVGDIAEDARSGRNLIPTAITTEVRDGMCACEVLNPGGG